MKKYYRKSKSFALKYCLNCTHDVFLCCPYKDGGDCRRMGCYTSMGIRQDEVDELVEIGLYTKEEANRFLETHCIKVGNNMYESAIERR